jgi:hypothetical protein
MATYLSESPGTSIFVLKGIDVSTDITISIRRRIIHIPIKRTGIRPIIRITTEMGE